jgi:hypothetical protein
MSVARWTNFIFIVIQGMILLAAKPGIEDRIMEHEIELPSFRDQVLKFFKTTTLPRPQGYQQ